MHIFKKVYLKHSNVLLMFNLLLLNEFLILLVLYLFIIFLYLLYTFGNYFLFTEILSPSSWVKFSITS